ncbi:hypothetical protein V6N13_129327 [Hibiscus sabdariffa]
MVDNPFDCLFSEAPTNSSLDLCPVFRVSDVKFGNKNACGRALFSKDGTIKAMFSGPVSCNEYIGVDIAVVKAALEVFKARRRGMASINLNGFKLGGEEQVVQRCEVTQLGAAQGVLYCSRNSSSLVVL